MNIFEKKLQNSSGDSLPIDPIKLYQTCSYKEKYSYLRGIQEEVLSKWHNNRQQRDVICKMNTGSGKTLTGLLMLYSKMIELKSPCLYVCPDNQLMNQTLNLALDYGIPVCVFEDRDIPTDFLNSKKILICNFSKLFNGKSIFKRRQVKIGALILDDAHKCVDIARDQSTVKLKRSHDVSKKLFALFEQDLKQQLPGTFSRLEAGDPQMSMKLPYWAWLDKQSQVIDIINNYVQKIKPDTDDKEDIGIKLKWDFMTDNMSSYDCFFGGTFIEISPIHVPYHMIPSYDEADHRYILSATFEDDFDLIRDLGIDIGSIKNPIVPVDRKDIGKRLILAPSRFDSSLSDEKLRKFVAGYAKDGHNVVVLVPSDEMATNWKKYKPTIVNKDNITEAIEELEQGEGNLMVFINRYDGVDLHGKLCRILVLDGMPMYNSLPEHYLDIRMESLSVGKKAQIIEQGLGRAVRSGGDFCTVYLMGIDLVRFLGIERYRDHFTPVTRAQLKLGLELLDSQGKTDSLNLLKDTTQLCLNQDESWLKYHNQEISKIPIDDLDEKKDKRLALAHAESLAIWEFRKRRYRHAYQLTRSELLDKITLTDKEEAWYLQFAAQMIYLEDQVASNDVQSKSSTIGSHMFHPKQGHFYSRMRSKGAQASLVRSAIEEFDRSEDLILFIKNQLEFLQFNPDIDFQLFEKSLYNIGEFLGFNVERPDENFGSGPDVLWILNDGFALLLEAKSQKLDSNVISKKDIEQLQQAELWYRKHYGTDSDYIAVTVQPNNKKSKDAMTGQYHRVMDESSLQLLINNLQNFVGAIKNVNPKGHTNDEIYKYLDTYSLSSAAFKSRYFKTIRP